MDFVTQFWRVWKIIFFTCFFFIRRSANNWNEKLLAIACVWSFIFPLKTPFFLYLVHRFDIYLSSTFAWFSCKNFAFSVSYTFITFANYLCVCVPLTFSTHKDSIIRECGVQNSVTSNSKQKKKHFSHIKWNEKQHTKNQKEQQQKKNKLFQFAICCETERKSWQCSHCRRIYTFKRSKKKKRFL